MVVTRLLQGCYKVVTRLLQGCNKVVTTSPADSPIGTIHQPRNVVSYELF